MQEGLVYAILRSCTIILADFIKDVELELLKSIRQIWQIAELGLESRNRRRDRLNVKTDCVGTQSLRFQQHDAATAKRIQYAQTFKSDT